MAKICELEARMAEAWGDAPFLIPRGRVRSESEKSYPFQIWSHSTLFREGDEIKPNKKEFEYASPTRSHSPFRPRVKPILPKVIRPSAYFSPHPPSSPLFMAPRVSLEPPYEDISNNECLYANIDPIFTARRQYDPLMCLVIRNFVENIVDKVLDKASEIALRKSHVDQYAETVLPRVQVGAVSRGSSALSCRTRNIATRNIAVQAKTNKIQQAKMLNKKDPPPEEWSGSVRALRDSHVRLVLRQLRHIERLNRALDRRPYRPL